MHNTIDFRVVKIAADLLPIIDELTTSDLQACIEAQVSLLVAPCGLTRDEGRQLENDVLEYIYSAQEKEESK